MFPSPSLLSSVSKNQFKKKMSLGEDLKKLKSLGIWKEPLGTIEIPRTGKGALIMSFTEHGHVASLGPALLKHQGTGEDQPCS